MRRTLFALIILCVLCFCSQKRNSIDVEEPAGEEQPDSESWNITLVLTKEGVKTAEVKAGHMKSFTIRNTSELSDSVEADFYNDNGAHTSRLTALEAAIDDSKELIVARNKVVVVSDSGGVTLKTSELFYDRHRDLIYTDKYVIFVTETDTLKGYGFESDRALRHYTIHQISGKFKRVLEKK